MTPALLLAATAAALGSAADCVTTAVVFRSGGAKDLNTWATKLFGKNPTIGSAIVSAVFIGACLAGGHYSPSPYIAGTLWAFALLRFAAAALNTRAIRRQKGTACTTTS